jgi:hypothetical protein
MRIEKLLISTVLLAFSSIANSATIYLDETKYLKALEDLGYGWIYEGFEDNIVWADSRASIPSSGGTPSTTSQGLIWESNFANSSTGTGAAHDGTYGFFSNPHGNTTDGGFGCEPVETEWNDPCWQYDGWIVESETSETLYGIGGWIDSDTTGAKITFLLDGVNVNPDRDGEAFLGWTFVGIIDETGFSTVEIVELTGADYDQHHIWGDSFTVGVSAIPAPAAVWLFGSGLIGLVGMARRKKA